MLNSWNEIRHVQIITDNINELNIRKTLNSLICIASALSITSGRNFFQKYPWMHQNKYISYQIIAS